eukprot:2393173-Amphidinium_carterae.1
MQLALSDNHQLVTDWSLAEAVRVGGARRLWSRSEVSEDTKPGEGRIGNYSRQNADMKMPAKSFVEPATQPIEPQESEDSDVPKRNILTKSCSTLRFAVVFVAEKTSVGCVVKLLRSEVGDE